MTYKLGLQHRLLQARLCEQEAATAEQSACAQKLQEAVETGKGKLAESAAFMRKLQDEQTRAKEQIAEYAAQVTETATSNNTVRTFWCSSNQACRETSALCCLQLLHTQLHFHMTC